MNFNTNPIFNNILKAKKYCVIHLLFMLLITTDNTQEMPVTKSSPNKFMDGKYDDMNIFPSAQTRGAINPSEELKIWPDGKVYYKFPDNFDFEAQKDITTFSMKDISDNTCIEFIEGISPDGSYIEFTQENEFLCSSNISKIGGKQLVYVGEFCLIVPRTGAHELLHAIGFFHEFNRPDRDKYIKINHDNIDPNAVRNYYIHNDSEINSFGSYYDYGSIMHYPQSGYASPSPMGTPSNVWEATKLFMTPWIPENQIGMNDKLSDQDIYQIQRLYDCCGIPWNYNSTAKPVDFRKKMSVPKPKKSLSASKRKKLRKQHAKMPLEFAYSICKHHSNFLQSLSVQGRMKFRLTNDRKIIESFRSKNVIWINCSHNNTSCHPFVLENEALKNDDFVILQKNPGEFGDHFQGDLLNDPSGFRRETPSGEVDWTWPFGRIPYRFADHVQHADKNFILKVMLDIERRTCIQFREPDGGITNYLLVSTNRQGCFAHFGYNKSLTVHELNLHSVGCLARFRAFGVTTHELLHVIGLPHEHTKITRDHWITINSDNIKPDKLKEFQPVDLGNRLTHAWPVLYDSIMMVPNDFHATSPGVVTIVPKEDIGRLVLGQRKQMTAEDVAKVLQMYKCCAKR